MPKLANHSASETLRMFFFLVEISLQVQAKFFLFFFFFFLPFFSGAASESIIDASRLGDQTQGRTHPVDGGIEKLGIQHLLIRFYLPDLCFILSSHLGLFL